MSDGLEELPPWGRTRWFASVLLLGLLHLGALFALSDLGPSQPPREPDSFDVRLFTEPHAAAALLDAHALNNPTLLASANPQGFSGPAWLNVDPPPFKLPEWRDEPRWLAQDTTDLGEAFRYYVRTNLGTSLSVAASSAPPETPPPGVQPARDVSRIHVTGDLAQRRLIDRPQLESLPAPDLLLPTEIEVLVDRDGYIFSPRLRHRPLITVPTQATAQRSADRRALELTRKLRFAAMRHLPSSDDFPFTKGVIVFNWTTLPPAVTNRYQP